MLDSEFHFPASNIWNLSNRGHNIIEMVVVKAAVPDLITALANNKFGLKLAVDYDPRRPDRLESSEESLGKFRSRLNREILRITRESEKLLRHSLVFKLKTLARFLEAYRDGTSNEPDIPSDPEPYYVSAFNQTPEVTNIHVSEMLC